MRRAVPMPPTASYSLWCGNGWLGSPLPALFERFTDLGVGFEIEKNSLAQPGHQLSLLTRERNTLSGKHGRLGNFSHGLVGHLLAPRRQVDQEPAFIGRVGTPLDKPRRRQSIDFLRDRPGGYQQRPEQIGRPPRVVAPGAP